MSAKLNVNIDHVATIREARKTIEPNLIAAAMLCEQAGADGITVHLRQDRRHIQDKDIFVLRDCLTTYLNVEMAASEEMMKIAIVAKPDAVTIVPETPNEITTTGGLNVIKNISAVRAAVALLRENNIYASVFVGPETKQIEACQKIGVQQIELCTAEYAELTLGSRGLHGEGTMKVAQELRLINDASVHATQLGLKVAAGHGLTYRNIASVAEIREIAEFNIGHNIMARSMFVGIERAVTEMIVAIKDK
jgi:pyridoxine 5-phosphate synthase